MAKEIAVFVDEEGKTASLVQRGKIIVYQKKQGLWQVSREKDFALDNHQGMSGLRKSMAEALSFLDNCKVFVALSVVGLPYFELEKACCSVWEFDGLALDLLDYVSAQEEEILALDLHQGQIPAIPEPFEVSPGFFQISLKEIQRNNSAITSKQALMPFLRRGQFYSLEVFCDHVPPWLEAELLAGKLVGDVQKISKDETRVSISKICCCESC